jgi:hypothetical protein
MDWLRLQYPEIALHTMHIANERKTSIQAGYFLKRMGVLPGVSDIFMAWPVCHYHGLFIEVKSSKGKPTKSQIDFLNRVSAKGYMARLCYGAQEVIDTMKMYINLS